ncbi:DNA recombination protein RmuC [Nocardioides sp.]|uniref:DNA recombination protein RmuC n=1 Tax=Nocardioides sp. TaxID=35761 RepID=UPI002639AC01|nr:DNA recombination protein RmuC [Nocardioides sp.]
MSLSTTLALLLVLLVGIGLGLALGLALGVLRRPASAVDPEVHDVLEGLDRLHDHLRDLEHARSSWQGQLHQQVDDVRRSAEGLRRETHQLTTALRRPQVRGRWGELHLRRTVELAGLVDRCDFSEQVRLEQGALRPDLVVHLAGGRDVVVDAKVPLDAYLDATAAGDDAERDQHLQRHARQVRTHVDQLGSKAYWRALEATPEFVVLFVPAESFLSAALDADPGLLEHAATRQVVLASPTTLIALLRTVAHGWQHEALAAQAQEIHRLGRELHGRLQTLDGHLDRVGRSLNAAVGSYNAAMGSLDSRVLVSARRFSELAVTDEELPAPRPVDLRAVERRGEERRAGEDPVPEVG